MSSTRAVAPPPPPPPPPTLRMFVRALKQSALSGCRGGNVLARRKT